MLTVDAEPLAHAGVLEGARAVVAQRGDDFEAILKAARISIIRSEQDDPLVALNGVAKLFESLAETYRDPGFGLRCSEAFPRGASGVFGFIVINAKDLRSALNAVGRYATLVVSPSTAGFDEDDETGALWWRYPETLRETHVQYNMFVAGVFANRFRVTGGPDGFPDRVEFNHRDPGCRDLSEKLLGRDIVFNAASNKIVYARSKLTLPLQNSDPNMFAVARQLGDLLLSARGQSPDFVSQVKDAVISDLGQVSPTLETTARTLHISERTLQRKLARNNTTFERVLSDARQMIAERLLRDTDLQLTEIAFMLGFSELSAFTRAANRWFGMSPREFRAASRLQHEANP